MWPSFPGLWGKTSFGLPINAPPHRFPLFSLAGAGGRGSLGGQGKLGGQGMLEERWLCPGLNWSEECLPRWRWVSATAISSSSSFREHPGLLASEEPLSHVLADTSGQAGRDSVGLAGRE